MLSLLLSYFLKNKDKIESTNFDYYIYSKTDNNAVSLETTNNIFLDLFTNIVRDYEYTELDNLLYKCMQENPYRTIAIILNSRDRINGKKEKKTQNKLHKLQASYIHVGSFILQRKNHVGKGCRGFFEKKFIFSFNSALIFI